MMVFATLKRCRCRRQIRQELRALLGARPPERLSAQSAESAFSRRETGPSGEESVYSEGAPDGGKGKSPKMGGLMIEGNLAGDGT